MDITNITRRERGQSLVEAVIVIPIFGAFLLGIFQGVLVYRAKSDLDYAAMQAARSGATSFAQKSAMLDGLARGLAPLYAHNSSSSEAFKAYIKARADIQAGQAATIQIVSPTQAAFDDFKQPEFDGVNAIPNDSLPFRGNDIGSRSHMTIQDANLLKIKVDYRYPLIVPIIDRIIGQRDPVRSTTGHPVYSLTIEAQATALMQTPIRYRNLLPPGGANNGSNGGNGNGSGNAGGGATNNGGSGSGSGSGNSGGGGGSNQPPSSCDPATDPSGCLPSGCQAGDPSCDPRCGTSMCCGL